MPQTLAPPSPAELAAAMVEAAAAGDHAALDALRDYARDLARAPGPDAPEPPPGDAR